MQACPTGALMPATMVDENNVYLGKPDRTVDSVCPYCGVGCQLTYQIKDDKIVAVEGKNGPANQHRLCVKGRFGFDYVAQPAAPAEADDPQGRRAEGRRTNSSTRRTRGRISAKPPGKRRSTAPRTA